MIGMVPSSEPWRRILHALITHGVELRTENREVLRERTRNAFFPEPVGPSQTKDAMRLLRSLDIVTTSHRGGATFGLGLGLMVGVSLGTETLRAAIVDANGQLVSDREGNAIAVEHPALGEQLALPPSELGDRVGRIVADALDRALAAGLTLRGGVPVRGVSVAWPTPLEARGKRPTGRVLGHAGWHGGQHEKRIGVDEVIRRRLRLPQRDLSKRVARGRSHALNDANATALSCAFNDCRSTAEATSERFGETNIAIRLGGGIGAGTVIVPATDPAGRSRFNDAILLEGASGAAGELGHLPLESTDVRAIQKRAGATDAPGLVPLKPVSCSCGRANCLQAYAGGSAFATRIRSSDVSFSGPHDSDLRVQASGMRAAFDDATDAKVVRALEDVGALVARAMAGPILLLNPKHVTLAGSFALEPVRRGFNSQSEYWSHPHDRALDVRLRGGEEHAFAAAHGAALAIFRSQVYRAIDRVDAVRSIGDLVSYETFDRSRIAGLRTPKRDWLQQP